MMLLKMADEKDTPGADALMPVLTYVLIKVSWKQKKKLKGSSILL